MNIPYNTLAAVSLFAAQDYVRYYINGVLIESTGTEIRLVATNGHILGMVRIYEEAPICEAILGNQDIKTALKLARTKKEKSIDFQIEVNDADIVIRHNATTLNWRAVDGKFPNYLRVIPRQASNEPAQYNPEYLNLFAKASRILGDLRRDATPDVGVHYNGPAGALVELSGADNFLGVIMPQRLKLRPIADLVTGLPEAS